MIAKVADNMALDLEVTIVKATSHNENPTSEKYLCEILNFVTFSHGYVHAGVAAICKRLAKIRD